MIAKGRFLENQRRLLSARDSLNDAEVKQLIEAAVEKHLNAAHQAAGETPDGGPRRRRPLDRLVNTWTGAQVEAAYLNLHAAEVVLANLYTEEEVQARVPDMLARLRACVPPTDQRRIDAEAEFGGHDGTGRDGLGGQLGDGAGGPPGAGALVRRRTKLRDAMQVGYDASDQLHARVRSFRNVLIATALLVTALVIAVGVVGALWPRAIPLCFKPSAAVASQQPATAEEEESFACPSSTGKSVPHGGDVAVVVLMGLLGGALSATLSVQRLSGTSTPYAVPVILSFLKVPAGALTAVIGLMLVHGQFVPGLSNLDTQGQILAYAVVLGIAQQLVTRFVDRQAQDVLGSVPSKESRPRGGAARAPATTTAGLDTTAPRTP